MDSPQNIGRRLLRLLLTIVVAQICTHVQADDVVIHGHWKMTRVADGNSLRLNYQMSDGTYRPVVTRSIPEANYRRLDGTSHSIKAGGCSQTTIDSAQVSDEFGTGVRYDITHSRPEYGDGVKLIQHVWFYDEHPYLLTQLELESPEEIRSNYLSPVNTSTTYTVFEQSGLNRMLKVPFDNDGFVRYQRYAMNTSMTSYEVGAFYEGVSRKGLVMGSVDHDHWKNAVMATMADNSKFTKLSLYSGVANSETHDTARHGYLVGKNIQSARFFIGYSDDWRDGMETFTSACNLVKPKRDNWPGGRPVGWMSWNVLEMSNNFQDNREIFSYFHDVLQPAGFTNGRGKNIMSIDSWSNLSAQQERYLIAQADTTDLVVGVYGNPFCLWWDTKDPSCLEGTFYEGTKSYKAKEVVLYANGKPITYDGAYCLDPTHPAVKAKNASWIRTQIDKGFRYMKLDFVTNGCMEADSYYNADVHTGIEAYNEGFDYFIRQVEKFCAEPVYINLSISPLFPYHYANGRRQSCDSWGTIDWTEYSMNAITAGWWTNGLYQYNDPDGLPLVGHGDQANCTEAENRSRLTSGIVSGHVMLADNFSTTNKSGRGNPTLSKERAQTLLTNPEVNEMLALDPHFRPVRGYDEFDSHSYGAERTVMMTTPEYYYVVVFNYTKDLSKTPIRGTLSLDVLGIDADDVVSARELWSGTDKDVSGGLKYQVPSRDCRIYRITRRASADKIESTTQSASRKVTMHRHGDMLTISASTPISGVTLTDLTGRRIQVTRCEGYRAYVPVPNVSGVVITTVSFLDGGLYSQKMG